TALSSATARLRPASTWLTACAAICWAMCKLKVLDKGSIIEPNRENKKRRSKAALLLETAGSGHRHEAGDALLGFGMGTEQSLDTVGRQRIDDHHLRCFGVTFRRIERNAMRVVVDLAQGCRQCRRVAADLGA